MIACALSCPPTRRECVEHGFEEDVDLVRHVGDAATLDRPNFEEARIVDEAFGRTIDRPRFADRILQDGTVGNVDRRLPDLFRRNAVERFGVPGNKQEGIPLGQQI